ncbi:MAG TPA: triose-phosphate isomerase [Alphaproteobacteria bacterium]|nr:triose-phosphate isomerase [Alphaproteobacteria bacterium]
MAARRPLIAGNWKMNGLKADGAKLLGELIQDVAKPGAVGCELLVCPPATFVHVAAVVTLGSALATGGQDCHAKTSGAHTGDVSAAMLRDAGATYVIVGHSERRTDHGETDAQVQAKAVAAQAAGLSAIICIGETEAQYVAGETLAVLARQIAGSVPQGAKAADTVVAYEPVWAIGTGRTPTNDEIAAAHAHIRAELAKRTGEAAGIRLLYGGSVKPSNAAEILRLADVDGALVGGASLNAADFAAIARACP